METINGYSVNDKSRLQAEIESFRKKRNTALGVGITMSVVAIVAIIIIVVALVSQVYDYAAEAASSHGGSISESEIMTKFAGQIALIYLFAFVETAGNIIALAGGISNHVKMANRRRTLERLRNLE